MNVLVTGGAGFVGCVLVPRLLDEGHSVTVLDTMYFGNHLEEHQRLTVMQGDIRDPLTVREALHHQEAVIHLAALSNDESVNADDRMAASINLDCFPYLLETARAKGVRRFIYASTSAVYGPTTEKQVTEHHPIQPAFRYAKLKAACEPIALAAATRDFCVTVVRPAALCGYSPRPRLDLSVNILTTHAVINKRIEVWGGAQMRCSLHVRDMADAYVALLQAHPRLVNREIFNVGSDNHTVASLAAIVQRVVTPTPVIDVKPGRPNEQSYRITSTKMEQFLGWTPQLRIEDAVMELQNAFDAGLLPDPFTTDAYYNGRQVAKILRAA